MYIYLFVSGILSVMLHIFHIYLPDNYFNFQISDVWDSDLYLLLAVGGHCFTYNPPRDGIPDFAGGLGLFLGWFPFRVCMKIHLKFRLFSLKVAMAITKRLITILYISMKEGSSG